MQRQTIDSTAVSRPLVKRLSSSKNIAAALIKEPGDAADPITRKREHDQPRGLGHALRVDKIAAECGLGIGAHWAQAEPSAAHAKETRRNAAIAAGPQYWWGAGGMLSHASS